MINNRHVLDRVSNATLFSFIVTICLAKIYTYILMQNKFIELDLGGGSDANYYHSYAQGFADTAVNIWPVLLRGLNDFGLYSRDIVSYTLFFLSLIVIPIMVAKIAGLRFKEHQKYYLYALLVCSIYPTMFFFSTDIFRDVFMAFSFLIACLLVKKSLTSRNILVYIFYFMIAIVTGLFLIELRPYLGYAFLLSLLFWKIRFTKKRMIFIGIFYFVILFIANYVGVLNLLTEYRAGFEESTGSSTLGLSFSNPLLFIPNFTLSFLGQMLGLYVTNPLAVFLLLFETIPFFFMLIYILKNIKLADGFVRFLIIFFVIYGSVWLIGNDNLGTAVRLRICNYLAIYISFFYILRLKSLSLKESISHKSKVDDR